MRELTGETDMDLRNFNESELQAIKLFTESLVENQNDRQINFDDVDLEQAEQQAKDFIEAKRAGRSGKVDPEDDPEIRKHIRKWLERTGRISRDSV